MCAGQNLKERERKETRSFQFLSRSYFFPLISAHISTASFKPLYLAQYLLDLNTLRYYRRAKKRAIRSKKQNRKQVSDDKDIGAQSWQYRFALVKICRNGKGKKRVLSSFFPVPVFSRSFPRTSLVVIHCMDLG